MSRAEAMREELKKRGYVYKTDLAPDAWQLLLELLQKYVKD